MIAMSPIFAMCDRWDIGGLSTPLHPDTGEPTIFIYDGFEGGIGISETLYAKIKPLWEKTLRANRKLRMQRRLPLMHILTKMRKRKQTTRQKSRKHNLKATSKTQ